MNISLQYRALDLQRRLEKTLSVSLKLDNLDLTDNLCLMSHRQNKHYLATHSNLDQQSSFTTLQ